MRLDRTLLVAAVLLALGGPGGCSGVDGLTADAPKLSDAERDDVRAQVAKALEQGRYNVAWNQEAQAGADRDRLEAVALAALRAQSRHAASMFEALRDRFGGLTPDARTKVGMQTEDAMKAERWQRAITIELMTADDPPAYTGAWGVYRKAPPDVAPELLTAITDARAALAESAD